MKGVAADAEMEAYLAVVGVRVEMVGSVVDLEEAVVMAAPAAGSGAMEG